MTETGNKYRQNATYRPPSRRVMQVEAWGVMLTILIAGWCFIGGLWMGAKVLWGLARLALGV